MRKIAILFSTLILGCVVSLFYLGSLLSRPNQLLISPPPLSLGAESVSINVDEGSPIQGWFVKGSENQGSILLLHSLRSNRLEMVERALFLKNAGYSVLLIDMQAHGESKGPYISFGYIESRGVNSAIKYLKNRRSKQPIGVIGVSLGGAAVLLGDEPLEVDAVILESVYSSIDIAVQNRLELRIGFLSKYLAPLLFKQIEPRLGISTKQLSPLDAISKLKSPIMIISGTADLHTRLPETIELFAKANEPKKLWVIDGAKHQNLHKHSPIEYESRIISFFHTHLTINSSFNYK